MAGPTSRGIISCAGYLPFRRLDRSTIAPVAGAGGGKGTRTVAGYDEDSTTLAVEAARLAVRATDVVPAQVLFGTTTPAYADKRTCFAGSTEEAMSGDAGAAFVVGGDADGPVVAELLGSASATEEYVER